MFNEKNNRINKTDTTQLKEKEEQRELYYKKIEAKINIINDSRKFIEENRFTESEKLEPIIKDKLKGIIMELLKNKFITDEQINNCYKQLSLIFKKVDLEIKQSINRRRLQEESHKTGNLGIDEETKELWGEFKKVEEEYNKIIDNEDLIFLRQLNFFYNHLLMKKSVTEDLKNEYENDKVKFYSSTKNCCRLDLSQIPGDKYSIQFSGYSINIILSSEEFEKFSGKTTNTGIHIANTPYIIIKGENNSDSIRHEENHNLSESFTDDVIYAKRNFNYIKDNFAFLNGKGINPDFKKNEYEKIKKEIENYSNQNFSEIIADIDEISERNINTFYVNLLNFFKNLQEFSKEVNNEEIKKILNESITKGQNKFINIINKLSDIFFASNEIDLTEEAKGSVILFKYNNIRKAEKYIKHKVGEEKYDFYKRIKPLICNGSYFIDQDKYFNEHIIDKAMEKFINNDLNIFDDDKTIELMKNYLEKNELASFYRLDNLKNVIAYLEKNNILDNKDKDNIFNSIKNSGTNDFIKIVDYNKLNFEKLQDLIKNIKDLGKITEIDDFEYISYGVKRFYILNLFIKCLGGGNYQEIENIYKDWPYEKKYFIEGVKDGYDKFKNNIHIDKLKLFGFLDKINIEHE